MKVLFAVSNESISEAIIKRYPKEYKEILTYKNVYYFDAILKEIQRDKSYDRIVISEDLEPFINTNHDSIDNFIFEHLDRISDEAHDNEGKETAIILICSERRVPGSSILNKLFSIGVYNAVMGKDRNLQELCRLINIPRNKKEAKIYYRIDQATYEPVVENEVNEIEIQNILTHFKKLGKNTERYADSFNNIAAQYTDEQLKIIVNVLPMKVKAVLEIESPKYQSLMGSSVVDNNKNIQNIKEPGIKINTIGKGTKVNGPIVIPSNVKRAVVSPTVNNTSNIDEKSKEVVPQPIKTNSIIEQTPKQEINKSIQNQVASNEVPKQNITIKTPSVSKQSSIEEKAEISINDLNNDVPVAEVKRGRGRPSKNATPQVKAVKKGTGKRGRPPKNIVKEEINEEEDLENVLPGLEESNLSEIEEDNSLPGLDNFDEDTNAVVEEVLPGLEESDDGTLPGLDNFDETDVKEEDAGETDATLPGLDEEGGNDVDVSALLSGLEENEETDAEESILPEVDETYDNLPGVDDDNISEDDNSLPGLDDFDDEDLSSSNNDFSDLNNEETILPGMGFEDKTETEETFYNNSSVDTIKSQINYSTSNLNSLLSKDKKIVTFIGTTKNGTSFLINNLALILSKMGIDTAVLDMTKNRNSYYIFTDNLEELRKTAYSSISKLESGYAEGIKFNKNFTVYTALPDDENRYENTEPILSTLVQNHSLVLIDCDFNTPPAYFASCQEIYLVQSMDILTIQPLTAFIRELKFKNAWEPEKARIVINKEMKVSGLNNKVIIAGMSRYNGPDMSVMTDLFNKDMIKACSIPFDERVCSKYLETMATCKLSLSGYSKQFMQKMQILSEMVYPSLNSKKTYGPMDNNSNISNNINNSNMFSNSMNNTLNQMKNKY